MWFSFLDFSIYAKSKTRGNIKPCIHGFLGSGNNRAIQLSSGLSMVVYLQQSAVQVKRH